MKKITFLLSLFISTICLGQELITNGTFESLSTGNLPGNSGAANGVWTSGSGGVAVQSNVTNAYAGTNYTNMGNDFRNIRQFFTATANTDYTVSFRYRNNFDNVDATDTPFVSVRVNDGTSNGNGTIIESNQIPAFYSSTLTNYTEYTFTFNSGSNTNLVLYMFKNSRASGGPNNAVRLDNVSIMPTSTMSVSGFEDINFKISPNPAKNNINLSANSNIERIEIYNITGQNIVNRTLNNSYSKINVSNLTNGVYLIKAFIGNKSETYKFIKQ